MTEAELREELQWAFNMISTSSGYITIDDLRTLFSQLGEEISEAELQEILDASGTNEIDFEQFIQLVGPIPTDNQEDMSRTDISLPQTDMPQTDTDDARAG